MSRETHDTMPEGSGRFQTTHWSVVSAAQDSNPGSDEALAKLCQTYWYPLYAFVRRRGYSPHDAQDLTQEFFVRFIEKRYLGSVDRAKGKFRTFMLVAMEHFLANEWNRAHCQKRGGKYEFVPLATDMAEVRYSRELADDLTPEKLFERRWATTLMDEVQSRLAAEYETKEKRKFLEQVRGCLGGDDTVQPYETIAAQLGLSESAVKTAVHRLRHRYRELLREEIARTLVHPEDIEDEIRCLFLALQ